MINIIDGSQGEKIAIKSYYTKKFILGNKGKDTYTPIKSTTMKFTSKEKNIIHLTYIFIEFKA